MRIAYLPLDERPVNTSLVRDVATLAGAELLLPPQEVLPAERVAGDTAGLRDWLWQQVRSEVDALVLSLDMLVYGGLIPSRTTADSTLEALARLHELERIKQEYPQLKIHAVSLIMRATNSYSNGEEPEYWNRFGEDLHRFGGDQHRDFLARLGAAEGEPGTEPAPVPLPAPVEIVQDFTHRRLRNHQLNLAAIALAARGVLDTLVVTSDDTAVHAAGSLEQIWLTTWARILPGAERVSFYPGADEVGAVLLARALHQPDAEPVALAPQCAEPGGWERIAEYENMPLDAATDRQILAAGARSASPEEADVVLILHAPAPPEFSRWSGRYGEDGLGPVERTVALVRSHLAAGRRVALADIRYTNGSDPWLMAQLEESDLLSSLFVYGGWNTAGNTVGTVVATAVAGVLADRSGVLVERTVERLRLHRILEDNEYQALLRQVISAEFEARGHSMSLGEHFPTKQDEAATVLRITEYLQAAAERLAGAGRWQVAEVHMPWHRLFEVGFELHAVGD